ncbi:MAG: ABC transporter ATP-binding protein [Chloroflexota bacterium]
MNASGETLLAFREVSFGYVRDIEALRHLSLEVPVGSVMAILGPNGAGKTTLLHTALGRLLPRSGQVMLEGRPLSEFSRREIGQRMGLVPQSERIPFEYSLWDYALFGRTPYLHPLEMPGESDRQVALHALAQVGLEGMAARSINSLSGGERQMAMMARALAQQPRLLLLDEPTAHLDLSNKARLLDLLRRLSAEGVTILLTTHEPELAVMIATHLVLVRAGAVLASGPVGDMLTAENLSALYGLSIQVHSLDGRKVILWT